MSRGPRTNDSPAAMITKTSSTPAPTKTGGRLTETTAATSIGSRVAAGSGVIVPVGVSVGISVGTEVLVGGTTGTIATSFVATASAGVGTSATGVSVGTGAGVSVGKDVAVGSTAVGKSSGTTSADVGSAGAAVGMS